MTNFMQCVILDFILDRKGKKRKRKVFYFFCTKDILRTISEI